MQLYPRRRWRPQESPTRPRLTATQSIGIAAEFGSLLAVSVIVGALVGTWLDGRLGSELVFTVAGVIVGLASAGAITMRHYRLVMRQRAADLAATAASGASDPVRTDSSAAQRSSARS